MSLLKDLIVGIFTEKEMRPCAAFLTLAMLSTVATISCFVAMHIEPTLLIPTPTAILLSISVFSFVAFGIALESAMSR